jgi:predicted aspartyl protease
MQNRLAGYSRRHMLEFGAASLAFAGSAFAEDAEPGGFEPLPSQIKVTPKNLSIRVMVNEKGPFRFVVDTGAERSVIAQDVAEALHLPSGKPVMVQGIVRAIPTGSVPVAELRFGNNVRDNLQMPVLPRQLLQADGYLGLDAIGANRVVFDFKRQTLQIVPPLPSSWIDNTARETLITAPGDGGHLKAVACRVDSVAVIAFIDSGAEVSVGNEALRSALAQIGPQYAGIRDIELTGITGGSSLGKVVKVETILFGNLEFSGCEIAVADLDVFKIWDLADTPALLIGLNFLRAFQTVSVDYTRKEYRLKLASSPWVSRKRA